MRLIFHIGMGKTGTTSIQHALRTGREDLARQKARYLGMWFDMIEPAFEGLSGQDELFNLGEAAQQDAAERFTTVLEDVEKHDGTKTFIMSNESLFGAGARLEAFFARLSEKLDSVLFVAYLRDPHSWLPSAYTQWGIRHKTYPGPIQPLHARARDLLGQYEGIRFWLESHADRLTIRPHEKGGDVVKDFAETIGISLPKLASRALERPEPTDILMRAMFNNRIPGPALPDIFDRQVVNTTQAPVPSLRDMAETCFRRDEAEEIIAEKRELFEYIRDRVGLDFLDGEKRENEMPDEAELLRRMIDYLVEISLDQAVRLKRLERLVNELRTAKGGA